MNDIELFIEKLMRTDEIAIHPNANQMFVTQENGKQENIAEGLARALHDYQMQPSLENYRKCKGWITTAYTHQMVLQGQKVHQTLKEKDAKIADLEQKLAMLQIEYDELFKANQKNADDNINYQGKLDQLREDYDKLIKALTQEGSVTQ